MKTAGNIRRKLGKLGWGVALAGSLYILGLQGTSAISDIGQPRIEEQSLLEKHIEIERAKITENNDVKITAKIGENSYAKKVGDNDYILSLKKGRSSSTLRHELYHILDGHCDENSELPLPLKKLAYLFWHEPQAVLYESTGIKL